MNLRKCGMASFIGCLLLIFQGCSKEPRVDNTRYFYRPNGFPPPHYLPALDSLEKQRFELGKELFFDPILSSDSSVSCGSCHNQAFSFADAGKALSVGVNQKTGVRNTPPLFNLAWKTSFMWDGGITHLEIIPLAPIINPVEMNLPMKEAIQRLNRSNHYKLAFQETFGVNRITDYELFKAIAAFQSSLISANSKFDLVQSGEQVFSAPEKLGFDLFNQYCKSCHTPPLFMSNTFESNGFPLKYGEIGRMLVTQNKHDEGKLAVPTLRNLTYTAPYMHDGSIPTLEEVMNHYSTVSSNPGFGNSSIKQMKHFTAAEKSAIISFLKTLNDEQFIHAKQFFP